MKNDKMKCWEFMKCGKEKRKTCPAIAFDAGQACWTVASTVCRNNIAVKIKNCKACDYYNFIKNKEN